MDAFSQRKNGQPLRHFIFLQLFLLSITISAQDSLNMKRMAVMDDLGVEYNDIWGYTHGAKEFAIVGSNTAINIVDVSDCANPVLDHQWIDGGSKIWRDFKDYGDYIYAVCDNCSEGLQVINKNDFSQYQTTANFVRAHNIFIDKDAGRLYVVGANGPSYHGTLVYDLIENPAMPTLLKTVDFRTENGDPSGYYYIHDIYVQNDTAYASHGYAGYRIWDMRDLNNIYLIGEENSGLGGYNHSSWRHETEPYTYVAEETFGKEMSVYDVSDITAPFLDGTFQDPLIDTLTDNIAHNPFVYLDRLYISYYHDGLQVYDVSDADSPTKIGYYDTYPENTNYNGYYGCWGTYPFLPSGCLLANDISHGLQTLRMTIIPEARTKSMDGDIVIDDPTKGVIFTTPDDLTIRLFVQNDGTLDTVQLATVPSDLMHLKNSNLEINTSGNGLVLRSPNGKYHKIIVDDIGEFSTSPVSMISPKNLDLENQDIYFSQYRSGLILQNTLGTCYHYTLGDGGAVEVTTISCD